MKDRPASSDAAPEVVLNLIREHLERAQGLMESINPNSSFASRVQGLIDDLEEQTAHDLQRRFQKPA